MVDTANSVFRDFVTDGVPASGAHKPKKSAIRTWGTWLESFISAAGSNSGSVYATKPEMDADLAKAANTMAWVVGDVAVANNGIYRKTGGAGTGAWVRAADLPYSFIRLDDAGAGTANAIITTSSIPLPTSASAAVLVMNVFKTNTGPVTVAVNGAEAKSLRTNSGNDLGAGYLAAGMKVVFVDDGPSFRLLSDVASAAIVAQAEDILAQTESALEAATAAIISDADGIRDQAQSAATEAAMYAEMVGAAVYDFNFDSDPATPGYDWND